MSMPLAKAADLLRTLGDETRLQILALLRRREFCVCELVALFPISQPAVSGHLRRLKDAGLAEDERRGMWVYYRARPELPPVVQAVLDQIALPATLEAAVQAMDGDTCWDGVPAAIDTVRPQNTGSASSYRSQPGLVQKVVNSRTRRRRTST